jgi:anthranilate synthase
MFRGFPRKFKAASYNSLVVEPGKAYSVQAVNEHGEIQAIALDTGGQPAWGVQFHPESFMSEYAAQLRDNWLAAW